MIAKSKQALPTIPKNLTQAEFLNFLSGILGLLQTLQDKNTKLINEIPKGDKGDKGDSIQGEKGEPGKSGRDGRDGRDGKDGENGIDGVNGQDGMNGVNGKDALPIDEKFFEEHLPKFGEQIRDALELLPEKEKLTVDAIQGLSELIDLFRRDIASAKNIHALGTSGGGRICKSYDLSPYLDGVTTIFHLPSMWRIITVVCSSFPNNLQQGTDWVYDAVANTITFTSQIDPATTLAAGQTVTLVYGE